ncbi:MAG: hypothetical protein QM489_06260 [Candidatus Izemoplasma sp.]
MKTIFGAFLVVGGIMIGAFVFSPRTVNADLFDNDENYYSDTFHCGGYNEMNFLDRLNEADRLLVEATYNDILLSRGITEVDLDNDFSLRMEVHYELMEFIEDSGIEFTNEYYPRRHGMWR